MLVVFAARKPSMAFVPSRDGLEHRPETMWDEEGGGGGGMGLETATLRTSPKVQWLLFEIHEDAHFCPPFWRERGRTTIRRKVLARAQIDTHSLHIRPVSS